MTALRSSDHISATERCSCGASMTAVAFSIAGVNAMLALWRAAHHHHHDVRGEGPTGPDPRLVQVSEP